MLILFLCRQGDLARESLGYARAFERRGILIAYAEDSVPVDGDIRSLLARCSQKPAFVLHPETRFPLFPHGLAETDTPTICFHYDVHAYTHRRLRWAMLFDYVFVFQHGYQNRFTQSGHARAFFQPFAVEPEPFLRHSVHGRLHEIGWVGRSDSTFYSRRRRAIPRLAATFRMNDWRRSYDYEELAEVYGRSKIGLNISRDDYPEAANLRVFEIMASGALLITSLPSELEKFGFQSGTHFAGYREESELIDCMRYYLEHGADRERIAASGRELVLKQHTYDQRVEEILRILQQDEGRLFAPARSWPEERVRQVYVDYYCANGLLGCALKELRHFAMTRPTAAFQSLPPVLGAIRRGLMGRAIHFSTTRVHK